MSKSFGRRLAAAIEEKGTPLMVGLDPRFDRLPESIRETANAGDRVAVSVAFEVFCREIIDVVCDKVAIVKPQFAFFEQLGPVGMAALKAVVEHARQKGLLVLGDAKRGDIGSTAQAYADAYLNRESGGIVCDALTVNPYMGFDTIQPFVDVAVKNGAGVFVLVKTSNPGSGEFQDIEIEGRPMFERVAEQVQALANATSDDGKFGAVGAVVGATYPGQLSDLRQKMPNAFLLIPGFGAQGGSAQDVLGGFKSDGTGAIVNSSRGIIFAYEKDAEFAAGKRSWQLAVEHGTDEVIETLRVALLSS